VSPEQLVTVFGALATMTVAIVRLWIELRAVHGLINSRMTELLELTRKAARAQGALDADTAHRPQERYPSDY